MLICPECYSERLNKFGYKWSKVNNKRAIVQQYQCKNCGRITIKPQNRLLNVISMTKPILSKKEKDTIGLIPMTKPKPNKTNHCQRCGYNWIGRTPFPAVCPKCHTPYWRTKKRMSNYGTKPLINLLPSKVFINPNGGGHYHIKGCQMIDSPDYIEVNSTVYNIKRHYGKEFRRCACVDKYLKEIRGK